MPATTTSQRSALDAADVAVVAAPPAAAPMAATGREQPPNRRVQQQRAHRTVIDFDTEDDLRMALLNMNIQSRDDCPRESDSSSSAAAVVTASSSFLSSASSSSERHDNGERDGGDEREGHDDGDDDRMQDDQLDDAWDWTLASGTYDVANSFPRPSVEHEVQRLQNVKSFASAMMDTGDSRPKDNTACPKALLDDLSKMAQRWFDVPICTINLMDLGRAYILSGQGVGDIHESDRKETWCSHTMQYNGPFMQVPDATKDWRFSKSPHVTGPFHLRFYASAPMVSPEGFRIGTFCIMGCQEKPGGLSEAQQETLLDLSRMACKVLVERRELVRQRQLIQSTAQDLVKGPMAGIQHCLTALSSSLSSKSSSSPRSQSPRLLATATHCNKLAQDICNNSLELSKTITAAASHFPCEYDPNNIANQKNQPAVLSSSSSPLPSLSATQLNKVIHLQNGLLQRLQTMMDVFPKQVPIMMSIRDPQHVPKTIVADEVLLIRTTLAMLAEACAKSSNNAAPIEFQIRLQRSSGGSHETHIVFECHHAVADAAFTTHKEQIFGHLALNSQQTGGPEGHRYGCSGSCMWFSIPLVLPPQSSSKSSPTNIKVPSPTMNNVSNLAETRNPDSSHTVTTAQPVSSGRMERQHSPLPPQQRGIIRSRDDEDHMELTQNHTETKQHQLLQQSSSSDADSFREPKRIKLD